MNNTNKLKPCPCCNSEDIGGGMGKVYCRNCNLTIELQNANQFYAEEKWNTRANESEIAELTKQRDELKVKAETFDLISNYHLSVERVGTWFMVWQGENRPLVLIDRGWPKRPQEVSINPDLALAYELSLSVAVRKAVAALSTQEADK